MIVLVLQGTGLLPVLTNWAQSSGKPKDGVFTRTAPGAGAWWKEIHDKYAADIDTRDRGQGLQIVFYGDDVVESWRGSSAGKACPACSGVPTIWGQHFGGVYRAQSYGIAGEQTANLLWRLRHGGHPHRVIPPVTIIHTGGADVDAAYATAGAKGVERAVPGIASRIEQIVKLLHGKTPSGRVVILGLLPRMPLSDLAAAEAPGALQLREASAIAQDASPLAATASSKQQKTSEGPMLWPSQLGGGIASLNARLERVANQYEGAHFVDCSPAFLQRTGSDQRAREISPNLMPDGRQPNEEGMHRLGLCLDSLLDYFVKAAQPPGVAAAALGLDAADAAAASPNAAISPGAAPAAAGVTGSGSSAAVAAVQGAAAADAVMAASEQQKLMASREAAEGARARARARANN